MLSITAYLVLEALEARAGEEVPCAALDLWVRGSAVPPPAYAGLLAEARAQVPAWIAAPVETR